MNKVIGIISYLPDDESIRGKRINKLNNLLERCICLFPQIPIYIVAQNWKDYYPRISSDNVWVGVESDKPLGIVGARKALRRLFLDYSTADYLIMLDDDCIIEGNSSKKYLEQIDKNPDCFIEFNKTLLKLFAISRSIFRKIDFDDTNPENGDGFEDRIFVNKLRAFFPDKRKEFKNTGLKENSIATKDPLSTWYKNQDLKDMLEKTNQKIKEVTNK